MMLNRLMLNRLTLSLLLAISLPVMLVGCQSNLSKNSSMPTDSIATAPALSQPMIQTQELEENQETIIIDTKATDETNNEATTLQWASNYEWKLTQVKDNKNNVININTDAPITLEVAPNSLNLSQGCQHFAINFVWMSPPPFEYGSELRERLSNCKTNPDKEITKVDIEALFPI